MFEEEFEQFIAEHSERLFNLCHFAVDPKNLEYLFNRKFLGQLHLESSWMEETMDSYGSQHNVSWAKLRETVAACKLFSSVCYDVLHLKKAAPFYNLLPIQGDFLGEMDRALDAIRKALTIIAGELLYCVEKHRLIYNRAVPDPEEFEETFLKGRLKADRKTRNLSKTNQTLVYLATSFLNLSADVDIIESGRCVSRKDYAECIPDHINEEKLRLVKSRFHNLQSSYDTYLSKSATEHRNPDLLTLRGHVSVIFHLLHSATLFAHYYERHILDHRISLLDTPFLPMPVSGHLSLMIDFFIGYADRYFQAAKSLCRNIITEYSEKTQISVSIPRYRGFHVRPSTLIAKIVIHYGSQVTMELAGQEYDASSPLELFRVNETINAEKRKYINILASNEALLADLKVKRQDYWPEMIQLAILKLMDRGEIVLYDQNLSLDGTEPGDGETPEEFFRRIIAQFLASGKIDIHREFLVTFRGDKRVLLDLKILADQGYGEDKFGNNIMLPPELGYLRR